MNVQLDANFLIDHSLFQLNLIAIIIIFPVRSLNAISLIFLRDGVNNFNPLTAKASAFALLR